MKIAFIIPFQILQTLVVAWDIDNDLGAQLSPDASITHSPDAAPRWSTYEAPNPGTVVNVATENDVALTVRHSLCPIPQPSH